MAVTIQDFAHTKTRQDLPEIKQGHIVKVYQKIFETKEVGKKKETKERIQIYEGLVIGRKGGKGINANITVRKISAGVGVERIFPLSSPTIEKIELVKKIKVRRAKLNYTRGLIGKATRPKGELIKKEEVKKETVAIEEKKPEIAAVTTEEKKPEAVEKKVEEAKA